MTPPRILIAGIGNIFLGDDAFGVEVVQRILQKPAAPHVRAVDFGIRGMDLTYALLEDCDVAILVDAAPRGHAPGTLSIIEPDPLPDDPSPSPETPLIDMHGMDPAKVLRLVHALGGKVQRILVVACEPTPLDADVEMEMGLSAPVQAAIDEAVSMIESLTEKILAGETVSSDHPENLAKAEVHYE